MLDGVFQKGLNGQKRQLHGEGTVVNVLLHLKALAEALADEVEICPCDLNLLRKGNHAPVALGHGCIEQHAQAFDHRAHRFRTFHARLPVDRFQRVVDEVRIDPALHGLDARIPQRDFLFIGFVDQVGDLRAHARKCAAQIAQLVAAVHRYGYAPFA